MQEIELKFQIPDGAVQAVEQAVRQCPTAHQQVLRAHYVDTPDRQLAFRRMALRLRQEGDRWVQTLKAAGDHAMVRVEDNRPAQAPLPGARLPVDLSRHLGSPAEAALKRALPWRPATDPRGEETGLTELYRTVIHRLSAQQPAVDDDGRLLGTVELALDRGEIQAGALALQVQELEIELVEGEPLAVIAAARRWVRGHALWLDTRTKAHRGDRLAREASGDTGRSGWEAPNASLAPAAPPDIGLITDAVTAAMSELAAGTSAQWRALAASARNALQALIDHVDHVAPMPERVSSPWRRATDWARPASLRLEQAMATENAPMAVALARAQGVTLGCLDILALSLRRA